MPVVNAVQSLRATLTLITADAGYHSEANLQQRAALPVPALIADSEMRRRDARFAPHARHLSLPNPLTINRKQHQYRNRTSRRMSSSTTLTRAHAPVPQGSRSIAKGARTSPRITSANIFMARNVIACRARGARSACGPPTLPPCATSHFPVAASSLTPYSRAKRIRCA